MKRARLHRQQGAALLLFFLMLIIAGSSFILSALNNRNPDLQRLATVRQEMQRAKEALLAYAAMYPDHRGGARYLPCPDTNPGDPLRGPQPDASCTPANVGRLPHLELLSANAPYPFNDYFVNVGQQFWYAASADFTYTLDGEPAIAAVLIAPGPVLGNQTRPSNNAAQYLEAGNVTGPAFTATVSDPLAFNDIVLPIRARELLPLVTSRVIRRIQARIDNLGAYPIDGPALQVVMAMAGDAWYLTDAWPAKVTYTRQNVTTATVLFAGCAISYTLIHSGTIVPSATTC